MIKLLSVLFLFSNLLFASTSILIESVDLKPIVNNTVVLDTRSRVEFEKAFCEVASTEWAVEWEPLKVDEELRSRVAQLEAEKYSRKDFNERR